MCEQMFPEKAKDREFPHKFRMGHFTVSKLLQRYKNLFTHCLDGLTRLFLPLLLIGCKSWQILIISWYQTIIQCCGTELTLELTNYLYNQMHRAFENLFQVKTIKELNFLSRFFLKDTDSLPLCQQRNRPSVRIDITLPLAFLSNPPNMSLKRKNFWVSS